MRDRHSSLRVPVLAALAAAALLAFVLLGVEILSAGGARGAPRDTIELEGEVPVGVEDTPEGALAASDNYLALSSQTLEQDPRTFSALVAQVYAPQVRASALAEAGRLREADVSDLAAYREGARAIAIVAARRLDSYTPAQATITSWLAGFLWGPHTPPRQSWNLIDTTLRWRAGRWLVISEDVNATPAPVPSRVYLKAGNDRYEAFARLAGMSPPFYGSPGR
jgi:hypothetical protein